MEVKFTFSVSPAIAVLLGAIGVAAVFGIAFIITVPAAARFIAACICVVLFVLAVRRHAFLRGAWAVRKVAFLPGGDMEIIANNGVWRGRLQSVAIAPLLAIFVVGGDKKTFAVLAAFDSLPPDNHRQLRAQLQNARKTPLPPAPPSASFFNRRTKNNNAKTDKIL